MEKATASLLRAVFYLGLIVEVPLFVFMLASGLGLAIFLLAIPLGIGLVTSGVGSFARPRSGGAEASLVLHAALFGVVLVYFGWESFEKHQIDTRAGVHQAELARQEKWHAELLGLIKARQLAQAREYVRSHKELTLAWGSPLRLVLCPDDGSVPDEPLIRLLGERGAATKGELLAEATKCSVQAVQAVLHLGVPLTARTKEGKTALMTATEPSVLQFLVNAGLSVNARTPGGATPLMFHRTPAVTEFLLAHGADPLAVDAWGRSALHYGGETASAAGSYELLLKAGADPNLRDKRRDPLTPLLAMAMGEQANEEGRFAWDPLAADMLVKYGADPVARNQHGLTVLDILFEKPGEPVKDCLAWPGFDLTGRYGANLLTRAIDWKRLNTMRALLDAGADPNYPNEEGKSAFSFYRARYSSDTQSSDYVALVQAAERLGQRDGGVSADAGPQ